MALKMVEREAAHIDLLLTDVVLPDLNGRQLANTLQKRISDLKVLYVTGYSRNAIVHRGRLDPGVMMLQKPLTQSSLSNGVRKALDGF
jgi:CheY-like chemotaxis protein